MTFGFAQQKLKMADKLFADLSYIEAAKVYEEYLKDVDKPGVQTLRNIADSYYFVDDSRNALKYYKRLYDVQGDNLTDLCFLRYIQAMKGVRDYDQADVLTKEYLKRKGNDKEIAHYLLEKKGFDSVRQAPVLYKIKNLDNNSTKSDFGTVFYKDKIVFASSKDTTRFNNKLYSWNEQPFLDLYIAERSMADGSLFNESFFMPEISSNYHNATLTFSSDWKTMYYTTNNTKGKRKLLNDKGGTNNLQILKITLDDAGKIVKREGMPFNSDSYSVGHPCLSPDGKWLFFVSDMQDGYGESDIYVVEVFEDGTTSSPRNLGDQVNTIGREMFPYFVDGVLYFSSDGHYGYGGLDIFESKMNGRFNFSTPTNLGEPINSNKDDFAFIIDKTSKYGYISSNRTMGKGDDDIYSFTKSKSICNQSVSGKVINETSKIAIEDATVKAYDQFNDLVAESTTKTDGTYEMSLPCNTVYKVIASKEKYSVDQKSITTKSGEPMKNVDFQLVNIDDLIDKDKDKEKIKINPIYFEYNKSDITPQAATELDKVVFAMAKFPNIKIKIESHTDSRGTDSYNLKLSDDRAKSTQTYILSKGIDSSRIESAIGYGETQLVNGCSNGVKCTEKEHLANRRSDFIVIQK